MKVVLCLLFVAVASVVGEEEVPPSPVYGYHRREGIPRARAVRAAEEAALAAGVQRITGGYNNDISNIPYVVGLIITISWSMNSMCGATLISANRVVTAAHCRSDGELVAQSFTAVLGSNTIFSGGTRLTVDAANFVMHPAWNPITANSDIAVMRLPTPLMFSDVIRPMALPSGDDLHSDFFGLVGRTSGWGVTSDGGIIGPDQRLSSVYLPVMPYHECSALYPSWYNPNTLCVMGAGGRSACSGDSGGPYTVYNRDQDHWMLIGVFSYGHPSGCELGYNTVYTRVASFVCFIHTV